MNQLLCLVSFDFSPYLLFKRISFLCVFSACLVCLVGLVTWLFHWSIILFLCTSASKMISRIFSKPNYFIRSAKVVISEPQTIEPGSSSLASTSSSQDDTPTIRVDLPKNSNEKKKPDDKKPVQEIKSCATDELKKEEIPAERDEFTKAADAGVLPTTVKPVEVDKPAYSGWLGGVFSSLDVSTMYTGFTSYVASGVNSWLPEKKQESVKVMAPKLSRAEVIARTQNLVTLLLAAESNDSIMERTTGLSNHLMEFPASRSAAIQRNPHLIPFLLKKMKLADDPLIKHESRKCLALLGYMMPLKSDGIRVLSLDGGGTRGMMTLEILEALEKAAGGKKICELFDYICGVSTGGIIAVYLAAKQLSIEETRERYIHISNRVFNKSSYTTFGLVMKHSMYNTETWINILKEVKILI
uniref:PNPLA domain-containing protein n=1 Tax=Acrobeloides nanus TaxID=290746 RepID=A0A914C231_9BILA